MDSLRIIVDQNLQKRRNEIPNVEKIIIEEMVGFFSWHNTLEVVPTIKSLRNFFDVIRADELDKIKNKISEEDFSKIEDMTRRLIGRLLHNPTIKLREMAENGNNVQKVISNSIILKELFNLDSSINNEQNSEKK
jgi:glutamyl-tRNA reductase